MGRGKDKKKRRKRALASLKKKFKRFEDKGASLAAKGLSQRAVWRAAGTGAKDTLRGASVGQKLAKKAGLGRVGQAKTSVVGAKVGVRVGVGRGVAREQAKRLRDRAL